MVLAGCAWVLDDSSPLVSCTAAHENSEGSRARSGVALRASLDLYDDPFRAACDDEDGRAFHLDIVSLFVKHIHAPPVELNTGFLRGVSHGRGDRTAVGEAACRVTDVDVP